MLPAALPRVPEPARRAALEGGVRCAPQQLQAAGWDAVPVAQGLLLWVDRGGGGGGGGGAEVWIISEGRLICVVIAKQVRCTPWSPRVMPLTPR